MVCFEGHRVEMRRVKERVLGKGSFSVSGTLLQLFIFREVILLSLFNKTTTTTKILADLV